MKRVEAQRLPTRLGAERGRESSRVVMSGGLRTSCARSPTISSWFSSTMAARIGRGKSQPRWRVPRPWLKPIRNDGNKGVGYNYAHAIRSATKDYFLVQTVDWSYDITELGRSFPMLQTYDVLQGVRPGTYTVRGFRFRSDNLRKGFVSIVNYLLIRVSVSATARRLSEHHGLPDPPGARCGNRRLQFVRQPGSAVEGVVAGRVLQGDLRSVQEAGARPWYGHAVPVDCQSVKDIFRCWFL